MSSVILTVPDISCSHCEKTVTNALAGRPGIKSVRVDVPAKQVHLDYDQNLIDIEQFFVHLHTTPDTCVLLVERAIRLDAGYGYLAGNRACTLSARPALCYTGAGRLTSAVDRATALRLICLTKPLLHSNGERQSGEAQTRKGICLSHTFARCIISY